MKKTKICVQLSLGHDKGKIDKFFSRVPLCSQVIGWESLYANLTASLEVKTYLFFEPVAGNQE